MAIEAVTYEVFAGVTISVQLWTIDLSGKLAYFLDVMEELVFFSIEMVLDEDLRLDMLPL